VLVTRDSQKCQKVTKVTYASNTEILILKILNQFWLKWNSVNWCNILCFFLENYQFYSTAHEWHVRSVTWLSQIFNSQYLSTYCSDLLKILNTYVIKHAKSYKNAKLAIASLYMWPVTCHCHVLSHIIFCSSTGPIWIKFDMQT